VSLCCVITPALGPLCVWSNGDISICRDALSPGPLFLGSSCFSHFRDEHKILFTPKLSAPPDRGHASLCHPYLFPY
jgi:hypothetical protein